MSWRSRSMGRPSSASAGGRLPEDTEAKGRSFVGVRPAARRGRRSGGRPACTSAMIPRLHTMGVSMPTRLGLAAALLLLAAGPVHTDDRVAELQARRARLMQALPADTMAIFWSAPEREFSRDV